MSTITWTKRQNRMRADSLRGRKLSDETRAAMHATRIVGKDREGSDEWNAAYDGFLRAMNLRSNLLEGLERGKLDHRRLDADDPRWKSLTVTVREIDRSKLITAIRNQRLDEYLDELAEALGL